MAKNPTKFEIARDAAADVMTDCGDIAYDAANRIRSAKNEAEIDACMEVLEDLVKEL